MSLLELLLHDILGLGALADLVTHLVLLRATNLASTSLTTHNVRVANTTGVHLLEILLVGE